MILNQQLISFLLCPLFINERSTFFSTLSSLDCYLLDNTVSAQTQTLLFGNMSCRSNKDFKILTVTINILSTKIFDEPILSIHFIYFILFIYSLFIVDRFTIKHVHI